MGGDFTGGLSRQGLHIGIERGYRSNQLLRYPLRIREIFGCAS